MLDPYNTTIDMPMNGTDDNDSEWIIQQKENELYQLHSKMNRFHRRLSNITSSLKKFHHASPVKDTNEESHTATDSGTPSSIPQPNPNAITPFAPQPAQYDIEVSQSTSVINDIIVDDRPGNLYREGLYQKRANSHMHIFTVKIRKLQRIFGVWAIWRI